MIYPKFDPSSNHAPGLPYVIYEGYSLTVEAYAPQVIELNRLFQLHWAETEEAYRGSANNIDHEFAVRCNENASALPVMLRDSMGILRGYSIVFFGPDIHNKGRVVARDGGFFIEEGHRNFKLVNQLLKYTEQVAREMGAHVFTASCKSPAGGPRVGVLLQRRGYRHFSELYVKELI